MAAILLGDLDPDTLGFPAKRPHHRAEDVDQEGQLLADNVPGHRVAHRHPVAQPGDPLFDQRLALCGDGAAGGG